MKKVYSILLLICITSVSVFGQSDCEEYSKHIFDLISKGSDSLKFEFIELIEYQQYVDQLELSEVERENFKLNAVNDYNLLREAYRKECSRIMGLYQVYRDNGATFKFTHCYFKQDKTYPGIGFITCYYYVDYKNDVIADNVSFECIHWNGHWRIIDGFYDEIP